jgi:hypothetical protein
MFASEPVIVIPRFDRPKAAAERSIAAKSQRNEKCGCGLQRAMLSGCCQTKIGCSEVRLTC